MTSSQKKAKEDRLLESKKEIEMTPALELLIKSRKVKTEQEVEAEFNK